MVPDQQGSCSVDEDREDTQFEELTTTRKRQSSLVIEELHYFLNAPDTDEYLEQWLYKTQIPKRGVLAATTVTATKTSFQNTLNQSAFPTL